MLRSVAVHGAASEECTGETGAFIVLCRYRSRNVHIYNLIGDVKAFAERGNGIRIERLVELRVYRKCRDGEIFF